VHENLDNEKKIIPFVAFNGAGFSNMNEQQKNIIINFFKKILFLSKSKSNAAKINVN